MVSQFMLILTFSVPDIFFFINSIYLDEWCKAEAISTHFAIFLNYIIH